MRVRRSLAALCATVPLAWAAAGCSSNATGSISASRGTGVHQAFQNPLPGKCHHFVARGVDAVTNNTGMDIRLHVGTDCLDPKGTTAFYLGSTLSTTAVPGQVLWRSFSTVGLNPPVPIS